MASSSSSTSTMAMACFFLLLISSGLGLSSAAVLKVGDAVGWTIGKIDYGTWASNKTFLVGDTLLFEYNKSFHNVLEVKKADYDGCSAKSPIMKYATGNDSVVIKSEGDHYFLCGVPGHCDAGQKLKISALTKGSSAAPSMPPAGYPSSPPAGSPSSPPAGSPSSPPTVPGGSGGSSGGGSPSGSPTSGGSATPSPSPKASSAAVAYKGLGFSVFASAVAAGFMIMSN